MAMKETERSLRAYFLLVGVVSVLLGLKEVSDASKLAGITLPLEWTLAIYIPLITKFALGTAFVAAGLKLRTALLEGAGWIKTMLVASGVMMLVNGALVVSVVGTVHGQNDIVSAFVGLAITIYLHRNVTRLAAEAAAREGIPPPPPTARVV